MYSRDSGPAAPNSVRRAQHYVLQRTLPAVRNRPRLRRLRSIAMVEHLDATHARLRMAGPAGLADTVRDLTTREAGCCSFFVFTVTTEPAQDGEVVVLDVAVPAQHADVLASLAQRASTVSNGIA